jgi:hypothetical protein
MRAIRMPTVGTGTRNLARAVVAGRDPVFDSAFDSVSVPGTGGAVSRASEPDARTFSVAVLDMTAPSFVLHLVTVHVIQPSRARPSSQPPGRLPGRSTARRARRSRADVAGDFESTRRTRMANRLLGITIPALDPKNLKFDRP